MRCAGVSPVASLSPLVKPMRTSLTSGKGDVRVPSFMRSLVVEDWPSSVMGEGTGLVLKRGRIVWGLVEGFVVSPRGIFHDPSPARSNISLTVCGGSFRVEYASSSSSLGRRFCHKWVGRCATDPHFEAFRAVDGPIICWMCVRRGALTRVSQTNPNPPA